MFSVVSFARGRERAVPAVWKRPLLACERGCDQQAPQAESAVVDCGLDLKCIAAWGRTATLPVDARSASFAGSKRHSSAPAANRV